MTDTTGRLFYRTNTTTAPRVCNICGWITSADLPQHDRAAHEVHALEVWGMHSVAIPARPYVQGWADQPETMPSNADMAGLMMASA